MLANTRVIEQQGEIPSHGVAFASSSRADRGQLKDGAAWSWARRSNRGLMRKFISGIVTRFKPTTGEQHLASLTRYLELTGLGFTETLQ